MVCRRLEGESSHVAIAVEEQRHTREDMLFGAFSQERIGGRSPLWRHSPAEQQHRCQIDRGVQSVPLDATLAGSFVVCDCLLAGAVSSNKEANR